MRVLQIFQKYYEYVITKIKVLWEQKSFGHKGIDVKYLYKMEKDSDTLAIIFSACTREGLKARYNYVRTLEGIKCNRLYILDDFGPDGRGSYYLGHMPEFMEQKATIALVNRFIRVTNPAKVLFCGSCKGGYAALNIGSRFKNSTIIVGEPTYRIATEFQLAKELMEYWMGEINEKNINLIDYHLAKQLEGNEYKDSQTIHIFYSTQDEYIERHTKPLLADIHRLGYEVYEQTAEFKAHADLGLYFSDYLKEKVKENIV